MQLRNEEQELGKIEKVKSSLESDMRLVEYGIAEVSFDDELSRYDWSYRIKRWLWHEKYYKGLAAYCKRFSPQFVLEFGTCTGASAVCLAKYSGHVVTSDVTDRSVADKAIFSERITFKKFDEASDALECDCSLFDLVFVDIDHSGLMERLIHNKLLSDGYVGDVFYDDIFINAEMMRFWDAVSEPKLSLDWHTSGFGVVRYGGGRQR